MTPLSKLCTGPLLTLHCFYGSGGTGFIFAEGGGGMWFICSSLSQDPEAAFAVGLLHSTAIKDMPLFFTPIFKDLHFLGLSAILMCK